VAHVAVVGGPERDEQAQQQPVRRPDEAQRDLVLRLLCALLLPPLDDERDGQREDDEPPQDQDVDYQAAMLSASAPPRAILDAGRGADHAGTR
jgi:hypothetical protein